MIRAPRMVTWTRGVRMAVGMMEDFAVIFGAFIGGAEDGVGLGYFYEAFAGFGVVGVAVWMVSFGEGVE
jgi:hypothetical protein